MNRILLISFAFLPLLSCTRSGDEQAIRALLAEQAACWNAGDLECFMQSYWKSDSLMYIGSRGPAYGWQTTLNNYRKAYPDKSAMGELHFTILKLYPISPDAYFCVGRWQLKREKDAPEGHFTLLWRKIEEKWVIMVDHSS